MKKLAGLALTAAAVLLALGARESAAQAYPARPVKLAEGLRGLLGQRFTRPASAKSGRTW